MNLFFYLLGNLIPLYGLIALGFIGGRTLKLSQKTLADFTIFMAVPIVTFGFIAQLDFTPDLIALPVLLFLVQTIIAFIFMAIGTFIYADARANLLAMCCAMGNIGYFGLPLVILLFDTQIVAIYMFMLIGGLIFESTIAYYTFSRGAFDKRQSLIKLAKYPSLYAVMLGLIFNQLNIALPEQFLTYWTYFKGAYVITGMMIIGVALSKISNLVIAPQFITLSFIGKFLVWPLVTYAFIFFDQSITRFFEPQIYKLLLITAIVPPAANITAFAAQMNLKPEKAATTVLLGTVFALIYIPFVLWVFG
jgi:predicted permease